MSRAPTSENRFWRKVVMAAVWGPFSLLMLWVFLSVTLGVMGY